ncbi:MAG: AMP-binding protein, partial [bacterium]|nr:AMP-binding protein [bacterium]
FLVGGDLVRPGPVNHLRGKYPHLKILHCYGPTENTTFSTVLPVVKNYNSRIPIGKPIGNTQSYVLDRCGHLQPIGLMGELVVGGGGVARGYLNNPELTARKFQRPFHTSYISHMSYLYRTGDLARWLADGNLEFLGRIDHQVKIRGSRIELGEIENQLLTHDNVKEAVVLAKDEKNGDKSLSAYIISNVEPAGPELR